MKTAQDERKERLKVRTRQFALRIIKLYSALPKTPPQVSWRNRFFAPEPPLVRIMPNHAVQNRVQIF